MRRVLKGTDAVVVSPLFVDVNETPSAGTVTMTVVREDGTTLSAPTTSAVAGTTGAYLGTLTVGTHLTRCDDLTVTWIGTVSSLVQQYVDTYRVVGGHYVTIPELRQQENLGDPNKIPTAILKELRDEFAELAETYCGTAFVRRYQRDVLRGNDRDTILLTKPRPRSLISVVVDGTSETTTQFEIDTPLGALVWTNDVFPYADPTVLNLNVVVEYEYGWDAPPPEIRRACLEYVRTKALSRVAKNPSDAISQTVDGTTIRFSTPDVRNGRPTGILSVDAVLNQYRERLPAVG